MSYLKIADPFNWNSSSALSYAMSEFKNSSLYQKMAHSANGYVKWVSGGNRQVSYIPQVTFSKDGSIGLIRPAAKIYNLILQGGGIKGLCYPAFIKTLNDNLPFLSTLKEVAGTSAGATMAFMLAAGLTPDEIDCYLKDANMLSELRGDSLAELKLGSAGVFSGNNMTRSLLELSIRPANLFYQSLKSNSSGYYQLCSNPKNEKFIERAEEGFKNGLTFGDLKLLNSLKPEQFKLLHVTAFEKKAKITEYFDAEKYPDLYCHVAVRASMSIPYVFKPVIINGKKYTDGGEGSNVPIEIFSKRENYNPEETLALIFKKDGVGDNMLYGPSEKSYLSIVQEIVDRAKESFNNSTRLASFRRLLYLFIEKINMFKAVKKELVSNKVEITDKPEKAQESRNVTPPLLGSLYGGKRFMQAYRNDADKVYSLASNVLIVPHGEGNSELKTLDFHASSAKKEAAKLSAIKAAEEYSKWRKGMASYKDYQNMDAAIDSMTEEEKIALVKSTKSQVTELITKVDNAEIVCNIDEYNKIRANVKEIHGTSQSDLQSTFEVLKTLQIVNK